MIAGHKVHRAELTDINSTMVSLYSGKWAAADRELPG